MTKKGRQKRQNRMAFDPDKAKTYALIDQIQAEEADKLLSGLMEKAYIDVENDIQQDISRNAVRADISAGKLDDEVDIDKLLSHSSRSKTSEMLRNRQLIMEGTLPTTPNPDRFEGRDITGVGINGQYFPDSEVRGTTAKGGKFQTIVDPVFDEDLVAELSQTPEGLASLQTVLRQGTRTEYLSPQTEDRLYAAWKVGVEKENRRNPRFQAKTGRGDFNDFVSEYYTQQALGLSGQAMPDPNNVAYNSALVNTPDRLLVQSPGLLTPEKAGNLADLRYLDQVRGWQINDPVVVADAQRGNLGEDLRLSFMKATNGLNANIMQDDLKYYLNNMPKRGREDRINDALVAMQQNGEIRDSVVSSKPAPGMFKSGKILSNAGVSMAANEDRQARMDRIIYALKDRRERHKPYTGYLPDELVQVNSARARNVIADKIAAGERPLHQWVEQRKQPIDAYVNLDDLIAKDAARPVVKNQEMFDQFKRPYSL